jgi:hypothetical protein
LLEQLEQLLVCRWSLLLLMLLLLRLLRLLLV